MRIDFVSNYWAPVTGGIEDHMTALARAAVDAGHEVTVHALARDLDGGRLADRGEVDGIQVRRYRASVRIGYYTTRFKPELTGDLIHMHGYGLWTHDWVVRRYPDTPKVLTLHHGLRIPTATWIHRFYHWWHRRGRGRRTLEATDRVVAVTPLDMERLKDDGFPMERAVLIPNGVPAEAFEETEPVPPPAPWRAYIVYVGRLHREKSVDHALQALVGVSPFIGLVVAGPDHGERRRLERLAARHGFTHRVRFEGRVDEDRKRGLLAGAKALVLPSVYEAQGRVILEAWAQGTPAVAARVGGVPYLVAEGEDALMYRHGDVYSLERLIERVVLEPGLSERMGAAGRAKALKAYVEDDLLSRTLGLYDDLAKARPRG